MFYQSIIKIGEKVKITDSAKTELLNVLSQNEGKTLRVFISGFGWGGPSLGMTLDEFKKGDKKLNINDIDILVNEQDSYHTDVAEVDYVDDFRGKGLVIRTGNGC